MTRPPASRCWRACAAASAIMLSVVPASAQTGLFAPEAIPVPLSGRGAPGGSVVATQTAIPGATASVDTINPAIQVQGAFAGSRRSDPSAAPVGALSLQDALRLGVEYNLGAMNLAEAVNYARGQRAVVRGALMPNV